MALDKNCFDGNNWFVEFFVDKKYRLYRHMLILGYIFIMIYNPDESKEFSGMYHYYHKILWLFYFLLMMYINMYILVPKLLFKNKFVMYLISLKIMIVVSYLIIRFVRTQYFGPFRILPDKMDGVGFYREIIGVTNLLIMLVFSSTAIKLFQQWVLTTNRVNELEKNSLEIELRELKNQVNPHFLFNMLNNVNVLMKRDTNKASQVIMKLSDFLRHLLYQNKNESVALVSEVQFINDFLELEKIRRDEFSFRIQVQHEEEARKIMLPPNLFITFVENAVKHSVDLDNASEVNVGFSIEGNKLVFTCINTKPEEPVAVNESGGLGLGNIKRQLELLYGTKFNLDIKEGERDYYITLTLPV